MASNPDRDQAIPAIVINPSTIQSVLITLALAASAIGGCIAALLSFWKARDIGGLIVYLRGSEFSQALAAITTAIGVVGLVWNTVRRKRREVTLARAVPDEIAVVKGDPPSPPIRARETETPAGPATRLVGMSADEAPTGAA